MMRTIGVVCFAVILGTLLAGAVALAQRGYPAPTDDYVNDYAGVLNERDSEAIRDMLRDLEYQTGIEAVAVTINSITDYHTGDATIESFATNLFNTWGIGHERENNGVLILLAVRDRTCRIELGGGYDTRYDSIMEQVITEKMIPHFNVGDYSRGMYEGASGVVENVTIKVSWLRFYWLEIVLVVLIVVCVAAGISCMRSGKTGWGWAFFVAAGGLLIWLIKRIAVRGIVRGFGGGSSFGGGASGRW